MSSQIAPSETMSSETEARSNRSDDALALEEDARLRTDIRLLGRILGDTVRDQEGADVFDLVERIRQTSIRFHRDEDKLARRELEAILDSMSTSDTVRIVRAFSYFSHLANIAEDQNNIRQMRGRGAGGPRPNALTQTLAHAKTAGFSAADLRGFFKGALVSPVLTAHPTEVRRKSTMDREMEIAALLDRRERMQLTPEEAEASDEQLRRAVLTLWQTNLLRRTKLTVLDEVANGLSFYDYTFLHEVPRLHCALEDRLNQEEAGTPGELASFLTMGSWIGGAPAVILMTVFEPTWVAASTISAKLSKAGPSSSFRTSTAPASGPEVGNDVLTKSVAERERVPALIAAHAVVTRATLDQVGLARADQTIVSASTDHVFNRDEVGESGLCT